MGNYTGEKYSVTFKHGERDGERGDAALGLVAGVGTDKTLALNDFDSIMPWAAMGQCNTVLATGERLPGAFKGEEGFDPVNKDVFVYVPRFYYKREQRGKYETVTVSMRHFPGADVPRKFKREDGTIRNYVFLAAYTAGIKGGRLASRTGLAPFCSSLNGFVELVRENHDLFIESTEDDEIKNVLLEVEFATRDPQSIMAGAVNAEEVFDSGACDVVVSSSGSPGDNTSGRFPCIWRGCENPWGNTFRFRWNVLVSDRVPHVLGNIRDYKRGEITDAYKPLKYKQSARDGWADVMGYDPAFPDVALPVSVAESYEESSFGTYFWRWDRGVYALLVGGGVTIGRGGGARFCYVGDAPSYSGWSYCAALSPA